MSNRRRSDKSLLAILLVVSLLFTMGAGIPLAAANDGDGEDDYADTSTNHRHAVTFSVIDQEEGTVIDAAIEVRDSAGQVFTAQQDESYQLEAGTYTYSVSKAGFQEVTGSFEVIDADQTVAITLAAVVVEPDTYTVTFKDWDGTELGFERVEPGEGATGPVDPVRKGYILTGWDCNFANVTEDLTVTAQYMAIDYTLTINYVDEDGDVIANSYIDEEMNLGDAYEVDSPFVDGYQLADLDQAFISGVMPADDVNVTVVYIAATEVEEVEKQLESPTAMMALESTGYTGRLMGATGTSTNKHLTAKYAWISLDREIFVAFTINDPYEALNKDIINLSYGGVALFPAGQSPQKDTDYWHETELVVNGTTLTNPNSKSHWLVVRYGRQTLMDPMTIGLKYKQDGFTVSGLEVYITSLTVTYNPNGGQGEVTDLDNPYLEGETVTLMANTFTRSGYGFTGWNTIADGSGTSYSSGDTFPMPNYDVVLYAQWASRTLTITANNQTKTYGDTFAFNGTEFTVTGLETGDSVTSVTLTSEGAAASAAVGDYDIKISGAVGTGLSKYTITYVKGTLTVQASTGPTFNVTSYTGIYDGIAHSITVTDTEPGDTVYYSLTNDGTDWSTLCVRIVVV